MKIDSELYKFHDDFDEFWPNQTIHYKATYISASVILILNAVFG